MDNKNTPQRGLITINIVIGCCELCNNGESLQTNPTDDLSDRGIIGLSRKGKNGQIVIRSERMIKALIWLQDKEGTIIRVDDLKEPLGLDRNQCRKVFDALREKSVIYALPLDDGRYQLRRVDDLKKFETVLSHENED